MTTRQRLRAATQPTPNWSITDPATLAALGSIVSTLLTVFLHVGHPDRYVQLGMLVMTGLVVPTVALAKHHLAGGAWLSDAVQTIEEVLSELQKPVVLPAAVGVTADHSNMKLGRAPRRDDPRTLRLADYVTKRRFRSPVSSSWLSKVAGWPMMGNDRWGDCTCAAGGHMIECWTAWANPPSIVPSDEQVLAAYSAITGFDPRNPSSDRGAVVLDVLNYWRQQGIAGHKIGAFAAVDHKRRSEVRYSIAEFGGCYIGLDLPITAQRQQVWDVDASGGADAAPGSWGGHAVPLVAYNAVGPVCVTWGQTKQLTWAFMASYCSEAYALISPDWFPHGSGRSPGGFDMQRLESDLASL